MRPSGRVLLPLLLAASAAGGEAVFVRFERELLASIERPAEIPATRLSIAAPALPPLGGRSPAISALTIPAPPPGPSAPSFDVRSPVPPPAPPISAIDVRSPAPPPAPPIPSFGVPPPVVARPPAFRTAALLSSLEAPPPLRRPPDVSASRLCAVQNLAPALLAPSPDVGAIRGRLVFEGVRDGQLDPRLPSSRLPLAVLAANPGRFRRDDVFLALLKTFPGADAPSRIAAAEAWAAEQDGAVAREVSLLAVRRHFLDGRYGQAVAGADRVAARFPDIAGRANLVKAFALAQSGDYAAASSILASAADDPRFASDRAEIRFMQAWIAIEEDRRGDASAILRRILADHPWSPFAPRARQALALLEED